MPKFVIERQYLVPMYQHIVVEAEHLETAYKRGISDDIGWDTQKMDCDGARKTTITNAKVIPDTTELVAGNLSQLLRIWRGQGLQLGDKALGIMQWLAKRDLPRPDRGAETM